MVQSQRSKTKRNRASRKEGNIASGMQPSARGTAPKYYRLAELLMKKIEGGDYKKGDLFPGDMQLASQHAVSLITVRAAMRILIERGLVARYPGKGSFVLSEKRIRALWGVGSVDDLVMTGLQAKLLLLRKALIIPPEWVREKYSCPPRTKVYWFRTVRINERERFLINDVYHPINIGKNIKGLNFNDTLIQNKLMISLVQEYCGLKLSKMNQTMSAELTSADAAKALGMKIGRPLLVIDRDYFSNTGELIQVTRSRYRVDHYRYTINVARLDAGSTSEEENVISPGSFVSAF